MLFAIVSVTAYAQDNVISVTSVKVTPLKLTMHVGDKEKLEHTVNPDSATIKDVTWTSADDAVVTVDAEGNVTAVSPGTAKVTCASVEKPLRKSSCTVTVVWDAAEPGMLQVNEVMAANVDMFVDPSWNYGGWLELYNPTDKYVSVGGYWASDDKENLKKARIHESIGGVPAKGYATLWFDHAETRKDVGENWVNTQLDMKLDCEGGTIYISDNEGNIVVEQTYPPAVMRCSYARREDGGNEWAFSSTPTPGAANVGMTFANEQLPEPMVSQPGCLFTGSIKVKVDIPEGATLRYTTDGSTPTETNGIKSSAGSFTISKTTVYRFRLFKDGMLPSKVVTRSYIMKDKDYYLPVVSLVTDDKNLHDSKIGIYVTGSNGKTANQDYTKRNFNMEWDRPASFEFMANGNNLENVDGYFSQEVDIAINGGWSRKYEPRSFKVKSGKVYDLKNSLDYPFFADKPYNKAKSLLLRNGGNDEYNRTRLKDAALQEIARVSEFPLNLQSYQPVHVFVNGKYLAMLNMREPSNKHYGYANYGIDPDEIDAFEMSVDSGYVQKSGTKEAFLRWKSLSKNAADDLTYQQICDLVDIDDYLNYMAFKFFLNDWDWPHNNAKGFRDRNDGKFHFVIFDLDNCVDRTGNNIFNDFQNKKTYTFYGRPEYNGTSITAEVELVTIFLNMIKNPDFKRKFIDTYCMVGGSVFGDEDEIANVVYGMADNIAEALGWEGRSPYGWGRSFADGIISAVTGDYRRTMTNVIRSYTPFGLSGKVAQNVSLSSNQTGAALSVNDIQVPRNKFDGFLFPPVTLKATAPAGYRFKGWMQNANNVTENVIIGWSALWNYYDKGSLDGEDWTAVDYQCKNWNTGVAPLGYGNAGRYMSNATTKLAKTDASGRRVPTYYMRREFNLDKAPGDNDNFTLTYQVDDAVILYVNGVEVEIYHLWPNASYNETCQDRGQTNWYEGDEPHYGTVQIPSNLLKEGKNVVAAEVHNCNETSSDIWFESTLYVETVSDDPATCVSQDEVYTLPETGAFNLVAEFEPLGAAEMEKANIPPVRINEVSAGNSVNVNDYYKKDDWVELYNTTDDDIDLAGMFLTDKKSNPHKYTIAGSNTIIPAHGFKIIWCSKRDVTDREIHANFKLDNEDGKMVRIEAADGSWADSLVYCAHTGTQSVGRYPDGNDEVYLMERTTILSNNILNSQSKEWNFVPGDASGLDDLMADGSAGMSLRYTANEVVASGCQSAEVTFRLYNVGGGTVAERTLRTIDGEARADVKTLPNGIYVARVSDGAGRERALKFVIRK